jgi:hypothetical protein
MSPIVRIGDAAGTTAMFGTTATFVTGTRSFSGSKDAFGFSIALFA